MMSESQEGGGRKAYVGLSDEIKPYYYKYRHRAVSHRTMTGGRKSVERKGTYKNEIQMVLGRVRNVGMQGVTPPS